MSDLLSVERLMSRYLEPLKFFLEERSIEASLRLLLSLASVMIAGLAELSLSQWTQKL